MSKVWGSEVLLKPISSLSTADAEVTAEFSMVVGLCNSHMLEPSTVTNFHLAFGMHTGISSAAALHAQCFSALLPDLAKGLLQNPLNCGHLLPGTLLQLKPPAPKTIS